MGKEKMQKVLMDMMQAERYRDGFIAPDSSRDLKNETFKLYAQVFELNKITRDEFIKSYKFYMSRPDIARGIFDSLQSEANKNRENFNKPQPLDTAAKSKSAADSLKAKTADSTKARSADSAKIKRADTAKVLMAPLPAAIKPAISPEELAKRRATFRRMRVKDTLLHLNPKR
jgi:hypothetical protein